MAKIVIFEDSHMDIYYRYAKLIRGSKEHEFHLYALFHERNFDDMKSLGFKSITDGIHEDIIEADFYFIDGLEGDCFYLLRRLPRKKTFLISGDPYLCKDAKSEGYNVPHSSDIENIVNGQK